jgi:cysteine desulfurase/selenocysteine lyase
MQKSNFDPLEIKKDFPIFTNLPRLIYLDSASTSQKPRQVIDTVSHFYENYNANIHRGIYSLSQQATQLFETVRNNVASFIGVNDPSEIIFTHNTNEAINLVAYGYAKKHLQKGDIVVLSEMEHHANIIPWIRLQEEKGITLFYIPITKDFRLQYTSIRKLNKKKIKIVSLTYASNVLGTINPIEEIISFLHTENIKAIVLIDGAQAIPHCKIDVTQLGCDFFAFSSHKMLGPSGVGVLWGKKELLVTMDPFFVGSNMIRTVTKEKATWATIPDKFEAGTHNLEGVIGLGKAIDYLQSIGFDKIKNHEEKLMRYALDIFPTLKQVTLFGPSTPIDRLGVFSFGIAGIHPHDIAEVLNTKHIAIRSGHHCAQPLMHALHVPATARASIYLYTTKNDLNNLFKGIEEVKLTFGE